MAACRRSVSSVFHTMKKTSMPKVMLFASLEDSRKQAALESKEIMFVPKWLNKRKIDAPHFG